MLLNEKARRRKKLQKLDRDIMKLANKIQLDAENFKLLVREGDRFCKIGSVMRNLTDEEEEILILFRQKYSLCSATGQNNVMKQITEWTSSIKKARELRLHDLEELRKGKERLQSMKVTTSVSVDGDANAATTKAHDEITSKQDEANLGAVGGEVSNAAEKQSMKDKSKALSKQSDREEALLQQLQYLDAKRDLQQQKLEMEMARQRREADEELRRLEECLKLTKLHNELKSAYPGQVLQDVDLNIEKAPSICSAEKVRDWQMQNVLLEGHDAAYKSASREMNPGTQSCLQTIHLGLVHVLTQSLTRRITTMKLCTTTMIVSWIKFLKVDELYFLRETRALMYKRHLSRNSN